MTRKDYRKFADMFGKVRADLSAHTGGMLDRDKMTAIEHIEEETMAIFAEDNPLFDRERFLNAISENFWKFRELQVR